MQEEFNTTHGAVRGVVHEVMLARERKDHIIVVEYKDAGPTVPEVMKALKGYSRVHFCCKQTNNGAHDIVKLAKRFKIPLTKIRVVGVNLSYCVYETVHGFAKDFQEMVHKIYVPVRATNCSNSMEHAIGQIEGFAHWHRNVQVIK